MKINIIVRMYIDHTVRRERKYYFTVYRINGWEMKNPLWQKNNTKHTSLRAMMILKIYRVWRTFTIALLAEMSVD